MIVSNATISYRVPVDVSKFSYSIRGYRRHCVQYTTKLARYFELPKTLEIRPGLYVNDFSGIGNDD